jgi:hypothetical protein
MADIATKWNAPRMMLRAFFSAINVRDRGIETIIKRAKKEIWEL